MNGVHDLGGMHGFGPVEVEANEPVFHEPWERKIFGLMVTTMGRELYNVDEFRHAIERMDPSHYLASTYYEHWLAAMETLLVEKGVLTARELEDRRRDCSSAGAGRTQPEHTDAELAATMMRLVKTGGSTQRPARQPARFKPGDRVVVRNMHPPGHTRCPRYARGARGTVKLVHGGFVFPDAHAHGLGEQPETVYAVEFAARDIWGDTSAAADRVYVDLWESYLEPAGSRAGRARGGQPARGRTGRKST